MDRCGREAGGSPGGFLRPGGEARLHLCGRPPHGGHPVSGFANSKADLFQGAPMVVIPRERDDILLLDRVKSCSPPPASAI